MQAKLITAGGTDFVHLFGCGSSGTADSQIGTLIGEAEKALAAQGMALDNAVLHRIFAADRESREGIYETRTRLLSGTKRTASSSFIAPAKLAPGARSDPEEKEEECGKGEAETGPAEIEGSCKRSSSPPAGRTSSIFSDAAAVAPPTRRSER